MDKCGYDLKIFENQKVIQDYLCSLCLGVLNNPVSTPKGCEFCENCVLEWTSAHKNAQFQCPACLDEYITQDKLYISRRSRHQIDSFETHCSNASNVIPCHWKGAKAQHEGHMNICPVALVPCSCQTDGCGGNVLRRDVETHKKIASLTNQLANPPVLPPQTLNAFGCSIYKSLVDSSIYCGEWKDGAKHGQGLLKYSQNCWYQGEWVYDKMDGFGVMQTADGRYTGEVVNGLRHGQGAMTYTDGQVCSGQWNQDKFVVSLSTDQSIAGLAVDAVDAPVNRQQIHHSGLTPTFAALASATSDNSLDSAAGTSLQSENTYGSSNNSDSSKRAKSSTNVGTSHEFDDFILYGEGHTPVRLSRTKSDSSSYNCFDSGYLPFSPGSSIVNSKSGNISANRNRERDSDDEDTTQSSGDERCPYRLRTEVRTPLETYISKKTAVRTVSAAGSVGADSIVVSPSAASAADDGKAERDTSLDCLHNWSVGGNDNVRAVSGLGRRIDPLARRGTHRISRSRVVGTKRQLERSTNGNSAILNSGNSSTGTSNHTNAVKRPAALALSTDWAADASSGAKWGSRRSSDMSWREDDELFEPVTRSTAVRVTEDRRPHVTTTTVRKSTASYINIKNGMYTATSLHEPLSRTTRSSSKRRPTIPVSAVKSANFVDLVDEWESWESD